MKWHFWHSVFSLFFIALAVAAFMWLSALGKLSTWIPLGDFVLMMLAAMRLTRLATYDNITGFVRDWFKGAHPDTFRGTLGTLINCPWCTGLWFSLVVIFFYYLSPWSWYGILLLALASCASLLQLFANWLSWSAEAKKREANSIALPR